MSHLTKHTN